MKPIQGNELHELLYGKESAEKKNRFTNGLKEIEDRYKSYFQDRKSKNNPEELDSLSNHYVMTFNQSTTVFAFLHDSNIDESIKKECINLFNSIYN